MKRLPLNTDFKVRGEPGWTFQIVERIGDVALVCKTHPDSGAAWEVAIVQQHETYEIAGRTVEAHEALPPAAAFGRLAWAPAGEAAARGEVCGGREGQSGGGVKSPFWWVVKLREGGYLGPYVDKHVEHQREARQHLSRETAKQAAEWWNDGEHVVVRVWARLRAPKLPAWVKPRPSGPRDVSVCRVGRDEVCEYRFQVTDGGWLVPIVRWFYTRRMAPYTAAFDAAPPDVWAEGAMRAAAFLRAQRRAGR